VFSIETDDVIAATTPRVVPFVARSHAAGRTTTTRTEPKFVSSSPARSSRSSPVDVVDVLVRVRVSFVANARLGERRRRAIVGRTACVVPVARTVGRSSGRARAGCASN
jgi:hypothetical protein